jgi:hypothetical protein
LLTSSSNNTLYHNNFVNNTLQAGSDSPTNTWDNGYPSGGNYWSDYNGSDLYSGPFQNVTGSDGIGDTPYVIDANDIDHYPLMNPYSGGTLSVTISPNSTTLDAGHPQLFSSIVSGGTLGYSYQWYLNATPVQGAVSSIWTFTPSSSGSYTVSLQVTDAVGRVATSNNALVTVNGPLSVTISPTSVTMDVGQSQLFNRSVSGGTGPYSYQWYLNGSPVSGATGSTWTFTPSSSGSYTVSLQVTDAMDQVATSNNSLVTVTLQLGQSQLFTCSPVSGGTGPYSYQWYLNGAPVLGANDSTWTFTPTSAGTYTVSAVVTDSAGTQTTYNVATVTVVQNGVGGGGCGSTPGHYLLC